MAAAERLEALDVPSGGIADFVMEDGAEDVVYGPQAKDFGDNGIAQFPALAERMARYGRNEDTMLAHVAPGEIVVPRQFLEDPVNKQRIFDVLIESGIENPETYVVGSDENRLNPATGLPEFFLGKLFKKVVKGVSKVLKSVVKVVKKVAPIVLPIALSMTPLGPIYGAALGSGIGTLLSGGNIKDALQSALISGAMGGLKAGFMGKASGPGSFMTNVKQAFSNPLDRLAQTGSAFTTAVTDVASGKGLGSFGDVFTDYRPSEELAQATKSIPGVQGLTTGSGGSPEDPIVWNTDEAAPEALSGETARSLAQEAAAGSGSVVASKKEEVPFYKNPWVVVPAVAGGATLLSGALETPVPDPLPKDVDPEYRSRYLAENVPGLRIFPPKGSQPPGYVPPSMREVAAGVGGSTVPTDYPIVPPRQYAYAPPGSVFSRKDNPPGFPYPNLTTVPIPPPTQLAGARLPFVDSDFRRDGGRIRSGRTFTGPDGKEYEDSLYGVPTVPPELAEAPRSTIRSPTPVPTGTGLEPETIYDLLQRRAHRGGVRYAKGGGPIFPRRTGGVFLEEGVPGQDSVKAMLMPGEFVMTTKAVRGLGNGDINQGLTNMYSVMRNLERRGGEMS